MPDFKPTLAVGLNQIEDEDFANIEILMPNLAKALPACLKDATGPKDNRQTIYD